MRDIVKYFDYLETLSNYICNTFFKSSYLKEFRHHILKLETNNPVLFCRIDKEMLNRPLTLSHSVLIRISMRCSFHIMCTLQYSFLPLGTCWSVSVCCWLRCSSWISSPSTTCLARGRSSSASSWSILVGSSSSSLFSCSASPCTCRPSTTPSGPSTRARTTPTVWVPDTLPQVEWTRRWSY